MYLGTLSHILSQQSLQAQQPYRSCTHTHILRWWDGIWVPPHLSMIQIPHMDLILVSRHTVPIFKIKKKFKGLSCRQEHFCDNLLFCVCFGDKEQNEQMRERETDRQTNRLIVCVVHTQKYKVLSTSTKLTLHMQLCSQTQKFKQ